MQRGSEPVSVAVKTAKKSTTEREKAEFLREMNIMSQMVHPNIVQLYGVIRDGKLKDLMGLGWFKLLGA